MAAHPIEHAFLQSDDIKHLWETWGTEWRRDVLYNPYTMVNTNYIRLRRTE